MDKASEVVKWYNNHSWALSMLNKEQKDFYGKVCALIFPVATWWMAHFCSLAQLLDVHKALKVTASKYHDEIMETVGKKTTKAKKILDRVENNLWWDKVLMYVWGRLN